MVIWFTLVSDVLWLMGLRPSKAEAGVWMQENNGLYKYVAVDVDDLLIAARDPNSIVQTLQEKHKIKLKCVGHLITNLDAITFTTWTVPYVMDQ
jgi:hypothetical protein